ncbi:MAG: PAS domain-containing protein [Polyangiales bacterium]
MRADVQVRSEESGVHASEPAGLDYQRLFEAAPAPMMVLDPELQIIAVTDSYNRATQTTRAQMIGRHLFEVFPDNPGDPAADGTRNLKRSLERVLRERVLDTMQLQKYDVRGPDGEWVQRWWSCANTPVFHEDGSLRCIIHRAEDVTEYARERQAQRLDEIQRMEADLLQRADELNRDLRGAKARLEERVAERTVELADKNRRLVHESSERERVELALRESEAHVHEAELRVMKEQLQNARNVFNRFFTLSQDLMCVADPDGAFRQVNPAIAQLGYTVDEVIGQGLLVYLHPEDHESIVGMLDSLSSGKATAQFEARFRRSDGSYRWLSWTTTPDEVGMLYAVARDVTDTRLMTEQLVQSKALADSANRELESFCYTVAHDLRAPLRSIDGFSQALLEDYGDKLDEDGKNYLARLRGGAQRMAHLIDDLLSLSKLSRGELMRDRVDLTKIARTLVERLRETYPERQVDVTIAPNLHAQCDSSLVQNALENLIGNAWKFTRERADARIEIGQTRLDGERVFFVRDNGAGFDMQYAHKLFGAFQRLHAAKEFEGTGVGLASVQRVINRHGGRIWPQAEVGKGATFYFTLPGEELS